MKFPQFTLRELMVGIPQKKKIVKDRYSILTYIYIYIYIYIAFQVQICQKCKLGYY